MNRTIKFRGRVFDGHRFNAGEMVYGSLITYKEGLFDRYEIQRVEDGFFVNYRVDEDSIAQFVGYDADGREVYEGDKIFHTISNHESFAEYGDNPAYLKLTKLKEGTT